MLGIKSRRKIKDDAVPTLFSHAPLPKKRRTSIERTQAQSKKEIIEDALALVPEPENIYVSDSVPEPCTMTNNSSEIRKIDKAIDNVPKTKSIRTQYRVSHFNSELKWLTRFVHNIVSAILIRNY